MKKVLENCNCNLIILIIEILRDDKEMLRQLLKEKYEPLQLLLLQNRKNSSKKLLIYIRFSYALIRIKKVS